MSWHPNATPTTPVHTSLALTTTPTNVDLSSVVPTGDTYIAVIAHHPDTWTYDVAKDPDDSDSYYTAASYARGISQSSVSNSPGSTRGMLGSITDTSGQIKMRCGSGTRTYDIYVLGYLDFVELGSPTILKDGVVPGTWETYDCSADIPEEALAVIKCKANTSGAGLVEFKPDDLTVSPNGTFNMFAQRGGDLNSANFLVVPTSPDRKIAAIHPAVGGSGDHEISLLGYVPDWSRSRTQLWPAGAPPGTPVAGWGSNSDLDIGVAVKALAIFEQVSPLSEPVNTIAVRTPGDTGTFQPSGTFSSGMCAASASNGNNSFLAAPTDENGDVQWYAANTNDLTIYAMGHVVSNLPPTFSNKLPSGSDLKPYVDVSFTVDDDSQVDQATIDVDLVGPGPTTLNAIVNGEFQDDFNGTITANGNGYDVVINEHPLLAEGSWQVNASADDDVGTNGTDSWSFTTEWEPEILEIRATQRRIVTVVWDLPVRCRATAITPQDGTDRYTPVDWTGIGGLASDAQNPDHYVFSRVSGGTLSEDGEAVTLIAVRVDETEGHWYDESNVRYSDSVDVKVDFEQTARADYHCDVASVASPHTPSVAGDSDFVGYVLSQVNRQSLILRETLPGIARQLDDIGTGDLEKFFSAVQEVFNRLVEDIDGFFAELCEIDRIRPEFIDAMLYDLGDPISQLFDLTTIEKRKLASVLVEMYRLKGTCEGVVAVVNFFVGVQLSGCTRAWNENWRLDKGSYPNPVGNNDELGVDTILGPGTGVERYSFWVQHPTPGSLTADEISKIAAIVEYMKPAGQYYLGIQAG